MKKNTIFSTIFFVLISLLIFYGFLSKYVSKVFNYIDEVMVLFLIFGMIYALIKKQKIVFNKNEKAIIFITFLLFIIGGTGNLISGYQNSIIHILIDAFSFLKFPMTYICLTKIIETNAYKINKRIYEKTIIFCKIITIIIFLLVISNYIFKLNIAPGHGRYGLLSYSLGGHPTFAAAVCCFIASIFMIKPSNNYIWIVVNILLCAATLRTKAIAWGVLIILFLIVYKEEKINTKKIIKMCTLGGIIALLLGFNSIKFYFLDQSGSRNNALVGAIKIANQYLPIGSGYATFGTLSSINSYSEAYFFTGLSDKWGFMKDAGSFVGDGGWATEIGQFGYLGTLCCVIYIIHIFKDVKEKNKNNISCYVSILLYMLIASTSETTINSEYIVLFGCALVFIANLDKLIPNEEKAEEKKKYKESDKMIPKKIHYCWFGKGPKNKLFEKCLESWKKYFPDFEIIEWNEENFDIEENKYIKQAYECKKYAFVSDYVRLKVLYEQGGIYFDTDVEVLKRIPDEILETGYFAKEKDDEVTTGLGFAVHKKNKIVKYMLDDYKDIEFTKNGEMDLEPCPQRNTKSLTSRGYKINSKTKSIDGVPIYDKNYFCGYDINTHQYIISETTYTVHHYAGSWISKKDKVKFKVKKIISRILGKKIYEKLRKIKGNLRKKK